MNAGNPRDPIEQGYEEFREAWLDGEPIDVDELCKKYPSCEAALRARVEAFVSVERCLDNDMKEMKEDSGGHIQNGEQVEGKMLGDFHLVRELGRGGMGVVYEAHQSSLNRTVALKVLPAHLTLREETVARFKREAATAARLNHPGIVEIFAIGEHEGNHFFAMEFVEGAPLDRILERLRGEGAFPINGAHMGAAMSRELHRSMDRPEPEEAPGSGKLPGFWSRSYIETVCRIIVRVAEALECAHQSGVIHRDVKPSNILVCEDGSAVLTDFGLAREEGLPSLTLTGELAGTPHYIAPEQASRKRETLDHRVDIYSLGVTLYELLTLTRPYDGHSSQEVLSKIVTRNPSMPRARNELIPKDLETICLTAMDKDPGRRYRSAGEFGEDLQNFLEFRPIKARPLGVGTRTYRMIRRNPMYATVFLLLFLLVVVGPLVLGVQQKLANIEIQKALEQAEEEAATSEQVIKYLEEIFESSNPLEGKGKEVSAYELLQQGVAKIDEELKDQPKVRARLMYVMGNTYKWLGIYDEAEVLLRGAVETYYDLLGDGHDETIESKINLSEVYSLRSRFEDAVVLLQEALEDVGFEGGEDNDYVPLILSRLALQYRFLGRYEESEKQSLAAIEAFRRIHGEKDFRIYISLTELARLYIDQGRSDEAEPLLISSLEICRRHDEVDDTNVAHVLSSLGMLHLSRDQLEEAEPYLLEALDLFDRTLGDKHAYIPFVRLNTAEMFWGMSRLGEAESMFLKSLEGYRRVHGEGHSMTLGVVDRLVNFYAETGRFDEAEPLAREALEKTPPDDPQYEMRRSTLERLRSEAKEDKQTVR